MIAVIERLGYDDPHQKPRGPDEYEYACPGSVCERHGGCELIVVKWGVMEIRVLDGREKQKGDVTFVFF